MQLEVILETLERIAPFVSAISAVIAISLAIFVYSLTKRRERPVISLIGKKVKMSLQTVHLFLKFRNIGRNPALKVKIHIYGCTTKDLLKIKKAGSIHIVNQKDPGMSFSWDVGMRVSPDYIDLVDILFYIRLTYQDMFTKKDYRNEIWMIYKKGQSELNDMDVKDYDDMKALIGDMEVHRFIMKSAGKKKTFISG